MTSFVLLFGSEPHGELGARAQPQLLVDVSEVNAHRRLAHPELVRDLAVLECARDQLGNAGLCGCERLSPAHHFEVQRGAKRALCEYGLLRIFYARCSVFATSISKQSFASPAWSLRSTRTRPPLSRNTYW